MICFEGELQCEVVMLMWKFEKIIKHVWSKYGNNILEYLGTNFWAF